MLVPAVVTCIIAVFAVVNVGVLIAYRNHPDFRLGHEIDIAAPLYAFLPLCAILPLFLGLSGQHGRRAATHKLWPTSQATLPLSDANLGWIYLCRVLASSLLAALAVVIIAGMWFGSIELLALIQMGSLVPTLWYNNQSPPSYAFALYPSVLLLILWLSAGLSSAATLSGRRWIAALPLGIIPSWFLFVLLPAIFLPVRSHQQLLEFYAYLVLGSLLLVTVIAYAYGIARDVIGVRTLITGFLLFVAAQGIQYWLVTWINDYLVATYPSAAPFSVPPQMLMLVSLVAAPPALVPMAVYYNRHR
jgi:hypothetical protein